MSGLLALLSWIKILKGDCSLRLKFWTLIVERQGDQVHLLERRALFPFGM